MLRFIGPHKVMRALSCGRVRVYPCGRFASCLRGRARGQSDNQWMSRRCVESEDEPGLEDAAAGRHRARTGADPGGVGQRAARLTNGLRRRCAAQN